MGNCRSCPAFERKVYLRRKGASAETFCVTAHSDVTVWQLSCLARNYLKENVNMGSEVPPIELFYHGKLLQKNALVWSNLRRIQERCVTRENRSEFLCMNSQEDPIDFVDAFDTLWVRAMSPNAVDRVNSVAFTVQISSAASVSCLFQTISVHQGSIGYGYPFPHGYGVSVALWINEDSVCTLLDGENSEESPVLFEEASAPVDPFEEVAVYIADRILKHYPSGTTHIHMSVIEKHVPVAIERLRSAGCLKRMSVPEKTCKQSR